MILSHNLHYCILKKKSINYSAVSFHQFHPYFVFQRSCFLNLIIKPTKLAETSISGPKGKQMERKTEQKPQGFMGHQSWKIAFFLTLSETYEPHLPAWAARAWLQITQQWSNTVLQVRGARFSAQELLLKGSAYSTNAYYADFSAGSQSTAWKCCSAFIFFQIAMVGWQIRHWKKKSSHSWWKRYTFCGSMHRLLHRHRPDLSVKTLVLVVFL